MLRGGQRCWGGYGRHGHLHGRCHGRRLMRSGYGRCFENDFTRGSWPRAIDAFGGRSRCWDGEGRRQGWGQGQCMQGFGQGRGQGQGKGERQGRRWRGASMEEVPDDTRILLREPLGPVPCESVKIQVQDGFVRVRGEVEDERGIHAFERSVKIPEGVSEDALEARAKYGEVRITYPHPRGMDIAIEKPK